MVLTKVTHAMAVMNQESFGPLLGVMGVKGQREALQLMNDSRQGLTASVFSATEDTAIRMLEHVGAGEAGHFIFIWHSYIGADLTELRYRQRTRRGRHYVLLIL